MRMNEYQHLAQRTSSTVDTHDKLLNGALGLAGEAGEFADIIKKYLFQKGPFDILHLAKELGDILWYIAEAATALGYSLNEIADININKLSERYPKGFDSERSNHRKEGDV